MGVTYQRETKVDIPRPCLYHPQYGGKRAPTKECAICELYYIERGEALDKMKLALARLEAYGALVHDANGDMSIVTPDWMKQGKTVIDDNDPNRRRHSDGKLLHHRIRYRA